MLGAVMTTLATMELLPWWALYTRHQHEKMVADHLEAKGLEAFLPLYESVRNWKDRKKTISLPFFPGYVFVRGGLNCRLQIVTTPGVYAILCSGERIATIPEVEIQAIQRTVLGNLKAEPHPFLNCGDRVRVVRGSLEGVTGILIRKKNLSRLILSVETLKQSIAVEIDAADVEREAWGRDAARWVTEWHAEDQSCNQTLEALVLRKQPYSVAARSRVSEFPTESDSCA
jgi:transcription antitermination factor NusG